MGMRLALVATAILSVTGIKVPINTPDENNTQIKVVNGAGSSEKPIHYESENDQVDSYLIPPNSQHTLKDISDDIATLATYLLPPSEDKQSDYYKPTEAGEQSDWYPIVPAVSSLSRQLLPPRKGDSNPVPIEVHQQEPIYGSLRSGKLLDVKETHPHVPSRDLQPPLENAPNEYESNISGESINFPFERPARPLGFPLSVWDGPIITVPNNIQAESLAQFPYSPKKYKNPTKLYPKKYAGPFQPIPIPLNQFNEESEKHKTKPFQQFKTTQSIDNEYDQAKPSDDKTILKFEEAQKKRILKRLPENIEIEEPETSESNEDAPSLEQDTSATNYREPLRQAYPAPIQEAPKPAPAHYAQSQAPPADGDRTEFRMHGMKGPHSYQFGFDTGKGKNRQFRFEERDNNGRVKGHYGYMDKNGKLRVVNYDADPEHGFRAEPPVDTE